MNKVLNAIRKPAIFFSLLFLFAACSAKEHQFNPGDNADVLSAGTWYPSTVLEVKPGLYKIHYNNQNSDLDTWVTNEQIRISELNIPQNIDEQEAGISEETSETSDDLPEIIGTSWSLLCIYEKGTQPKYLRNFPEYLFCNNGRWELHSLTTSMGQMGTYTVKGNRLKLVHDGADKLTGNYIITWNTVEKYLELDDGKKIFRLRFRVKAKC